MAYSLDQEGQSLLERHALWWQRQGSLVGRFTDSQPLSPLWLPLVDGALAVDDLDLRPELLDPENLVGERQEPGTLGVFEDRFRTQAPYGKIPWLEAILGSPVRVTVQSGGMRSQVCVNDWDQWENKPAPFDQGWFDLLMMLTGMLVARSNGRYAVVAPTLRGPSDLAEALLGPEMMSLSMYDHPEALERFLEEVTGTFIAVLKALLSRIPSLAGGYVNPFGIWAPGTVVRTQCDASVFLSAAHYQRWYLPFDLRICEAFDYSIIHLHSCSLHTVDSLLAQDLPHAIQVTLESQHTTVETQHAASEHAASEHAASEHAASEHAASEHAASEYAASEHAASEHAASLQALLPVFRKILARKPLLLEGKLDEDQVRLLLKHLPNDGLAITARSTAW